MAEEKQLGALHQPRLDHGDLGLWSCSSEGAGHKVGTQSRRAIAHHQYVGSGEWYLTVRIGVTGHTVTYHSPLPTPHAYFFRSS
jgi:hypothetical protein